jgi:hypothetical protein
MSLKTSLNISFLQSFLFKKRSSNATSFMRHDII